MRRTVASIALIALLTTPAFATFKTCKEQTTPGGTEPVFGEVRKIVGTEPPGPSGWDGVGGQCKKPGSDAIWVGPRDANGVCLTPASIVGSQGGAIFQLVIQQIGVKQLPDIVEHKELEAYLKWVEVQTRKHTFWIPIPSVRWSDWKDGSC